LDTKFVISQLVTAVITIITTIVVVRVTLKPSSIGLAQSQKDKLKAIAATCAYLLTQLGALGICIYWLRSHVIQTTPVTRGEIIWIALWIALGLRVVDNLYKQITVLFRTKK
jgi:hypothetical protein